jgi:hypothetical protein
MRGRPGNPARAQREMTLALIDQAPKHPDGRAIRMLVRSKQDAADTLALAELKLKY